MLLCLTFLVEALSNVARHAGAERVAISIAVGDGTATVTVTDDGSGIPESGRRSGLTNLAARATLLGGSFTASRGGLARGTELRWSVPLPAA